jgi:hypothetical protein
VVRDVECEQKNDWENEMERRGMESDEVFLAVLRPEDEREMSLAAAKAALTAEKWAAIEGESLNVRALKMLRFRPEKSPESEINRKERIECKESKTCRVDKAEGRNPPQKIFLTRRREAAKKKAPSPSRGDKPFKKSAGHE